MAFVFNPFTGTLDITGGGGATSHNSLPDLQGGTTAQYYHLTETEYNTLNSPITGTYTITGDMTVGATNRNKLGQFDDTYTVTLPATPFDGERYLFYFGGAGVGCVLDADANDINAPSGQAATYVPAADVMTSICEVIWYLGAWQLHQQDYLGWMQGQLAWTKVDKTGAVASDIGALSSSATKIPFFKSDGTSSAIALTADSKIPFTTSGGTTSNIPLTT